MVEASAQQSGDEWARLVESARSGDQGAWERLYRRYRPLLAFQAEVGLPEHLRGRFDAEDVLQATFFSAFRSLPDYDWRGEPAFRSWLKEITRNELSSRIRAHFSSKRTPDRERPSADPDLMIDDSEAGDTPSAVLTREQRRTQVLEVMRSLEDAQQEVLWLRDFEQRTWEEIGRHQGCTESTARRHHQEALKELMRRLR